MTRFFLFLLFFPMATNLFAQASDSISSESPGLLPQWTLFVPGASYYYQKNYVKGTAFAALEIGGVFMGIKHAQTLKNNSTSPYYNYPLFLGLQAFQTEKLTNFKSQLEVIKHHNPGFRYHNISEKDLYLAPFKIENIVTPITGGMVLLAGVFLAIEKHQEKHTISQVDQMYFLNRYIPRNQALTAFGATSLAMSWSAGVGEEYIMRNYVLPILDYKHGQTKGLIMSSVAFGALHFSNLAFAEKPDLKGTLLQVTQATALGFILGRDVQKRGYNIGPAVAAHMWYDAVLMLGSFLINPEDNFLGVNIRLGIN
ncbi:CAAX protease self-immunity [Mariniphaga anaerophila]|uniref:CAAX protease self-immunity n=1 Tax=Mariniphaga anaerophila TaxID=1484053 RepID=A0A1M5ABM1_9BACT|nr:CPBP family intramembrane glutamic endopeptidase [Mariniphaga anaerophila]SHF27446.1 CAAX protease self-immunity [Mariniphaga anaerophila]